MNRVQWTQLARLWGMADSAAAGRAEADKIHAVHLRHTLREVPDVPLPDHVIGFTLANARSFRHVGGRRFGGYHGRGAIGLLAKGSYGRWTFETPMEMLHIYLPSGFVAQVAEEAGLPSGLHDTLRFFDPTISSLAEEVLAAMHVAGSSSRLYLDTLGTAITLRLLRTQAERQTFDGARSGLTPAQLSRACEFLAANLSQDVTLEEAAQQVGVTRWHFCRAFGRSMGVAPHQWRFQQRMTMARALLGSTHLPVAEVAREVGYSDASTFATAFRRANKVSPTRFRREMMR